MKETLAIAKALSDRARLRTLMALFGGELCVCQIVELLGLAPSTVSRHLKTLELSGLVESRKDKRWVYYRLPGAEASKTVREALKWVSVSLSNDEKALADEKALKKITGMGKEELCRRQAER